MLAQRLSTQDPPVDPTSTQRGWAMAYVEQLRRVRAAEHRHTRFPAVAFADSVGIIAAVVAAVMAQDAPHPPS